MCYRHTGIDFGLIVWVTKYIFTVDFNQLRLLRWQIIGYCDGETQPQLFRQ